MNFLSELSNFGNAAVNGYQSSQAITQKAQQIQQGQMALDQAKRELAAQAAVFQSATGGQQGSQRPPQGGTSPPQTGGAAAPGQPVPSDIQPYSLRPPPQTGQPPMPGQASVPSQPQMPQAGPQQALQGQQPPSGGMQSQGQTQGMGGQDLGPQGQLQIIAQIAKTIKERNPGIDPQTLFEAVKQQIGLLGALSNTQKQQLVLATDQLKADVSRQNTQDRVSATRDVAAGHDQTSRQNTQDRAAAMVQTTNARISDADQRLQQTEAAINGRQDKSMAGRAATKAQSDRVGFLRTQLSQAKQKLSGAVASGNAPDIASAQKSVDDAYARILDLQKKASAGAPAQNSATPQPASGTGPTATDAQGNKIHWNGTAWVPVPK